MSSIVQSFQKRSSGISLPVSRKLEDEGENNNNQGMRRRLSSLSLRVKPVAASTTTWAFQRSKSLSSMGEQAGSSIRSWWGWGCSWILSRKPVFAQDLEMNEDETVALGAHNRGSWRHVFYKVRSELRKLVAGSPDKVGLPQTCRYNNNNNNYSKNLGPHH